MKKLLFAGFLAVAVALNVSAKINFNKYSNPDFARRIAEAPWIANLTTCPYNLVVAPGPDTDAPEGYKPFYISHYGRHGTRSGWDQDKYKAIITALTEAKEKGILTPSGDSLLHETRLVEEATGKMDGRLTLLGQKEHRGISERMYERFTPVFRAGEGNIRVLSSEVPRCLVSMAAFTNRLCELDRGLNIVMDCGSEIQKEVTNSAPKRTKEARESKYAEMRKKVDPDTKAMMKTLFTDRKAAERIVGDPKDFSRAIFGVGRISRSFGFDFNIYRFLPFDAVYGWAEYFNARFYLGHGNSVEFGDARMEKARPLVRNIVRLADDAIASGKVSADLRFGHDVALLALCSYLGIETVSDRYTAEEVTRHIIITDHIPFAANLQIVFYRSGRAEDPVLAKVLLNENEVKINGLEPVRGPYYKWEDLRRKFSR